MQEAFCCVPVSPMRKEDAHRSEMVSQLLFGEYCTLHEVKGSWARITTAYDDYEGWCLASHLQQIDATVDTEAVSLANEYAATIQYNGQPMHVPLGSNLAVMKQHVAGVSISYDGGLWEPRAFEAAAMREIALMFINTAYLWGGRSVFGIDCSGFTQLVFKHFGIKLLRDAYQQAGQGEHVGFLQEVKPGDLAFFDNEDGKITHVGILLDSQTIIHASGKVRVDDIDSSGIINRDTKERSHRLRLIKRYA